VSAVDVSRSWLALEGASLALPPLLPDAAASATCCWCSKVSPLRHAPDVLSAAALLEPCMASELPLVAPSPTTVLMVHLHAARHCRAARVAALHLRGASAAIRACIAAAGCVLPNVLVTPGS
jgi:hypothetical protein